MTLQPNLSTRLSRAPAGLLAGLCLVLASGVNAAQERASSPRQRDTQTAEAGAASKTVVARLRVQLPSAQKFNLRGTFPIPAQSYPRADGLLPFAIRSSDGKTAPAQLEVVSWYPHANKDGADVVEILASVERPANLSPGQFATYDVVEHLHPWRGLRLTPAMVQLTGNKGMVVLKSRDVFGNPYVLDLLHTADGMRVLRDGRAAKQFRFYATMRPTGSNLGAPNGALTHFMGVHSYVTAWANEDVLSIDLRVSNGASGLAASPLNDPQAAMYFDSLDLQLPKGWIALQLFSDPYWGTPTTVGSTAVQPIVEPLAGGRPHVLPRQSQFHRRLVITPASNKARALELLNSAGLGFCIDGTNQLGERLYSWWNPETARYFPTNTRLPHCDWIPEGEKQGYLDSQLNTFTQLLANGGSQAQYPIQSGVLGWAHPWGVKYGGMTGGTEIFALDGILLADTGRLSGYKLAQITHRMYTDRQPVALFNVDGDPSTVEDWVKLNPIPHLPMAYFQVLQGKEEPAGWDAAPEFQENYVAANSLKPAYESDLIEHQPIDQQHYIRYTRTPKVLTWLGNDAIAKDDLELSAELMRLSYTVFPTSATGYVQPSSMLSQVQFVNGKPGIGFGFGRGPAWSLDTVNAAYATGRSDFRARALPWINGILNLVEKGQADCSGIIQRIQNNAILDGKYSARQAVEQTSIEIALLGMLESVYTGADPAREARARAVLEKSVNSLFTGPSWNPSAKAPYTSMAVDDLSTSGAPFCGTVPSDGVTAAVDKNHPFSSLELGLRLTGDSLYIARTADIMGASGTAPQQILTKFYPTYFSYLENRAPIIGALQLLAE